MIGELIKGLSITMRHVFRPRVTIQYPEEKRKMPARARWRHVLLRHEDGLERCIGCSLCAANCPARCILVEADENREGARYSPGERYAKTYEINMIRCIFCGYCQDACPVEAIVLRPIYDISDDEREDFVYGKDRLVVPYPGPKG
jgi:NADH-quinone oxidoreductase subunit I